VKALLIGLLLLAPHLDARARRGVEVVVDKGFALDDYGPLTVYNLDARDFFKQIQDDKRYDQYHDQVQALNDTLTNTLLDLSDERARAKGPALKLKMVLDEFRMGSAAARVWVGYGAGNGDLKTDVYLYSGGQLVYNFITTVPIAGGWGAVNLRRFYAVTAHMIEDQLEGNGR